MSWLASIGVALLTAVAGCFGAGAVAALLVRWFHITSREGASGFFVVGNALLGLFGGVAIGLIASRVVAAGPAPGFGRALGTSLGVTAGLLTVILGVAWLAADFPPRLDGQELVVETEVRLPAGATPPTKEQAGAYGFHFSVTLTADTGGRRMLSGPFEVEKARQEDGRWIVPASVFLHTSGPGKSLGVVLAEGRTQYFRLPLPGQPTSAHKEWSAWMTAPTSDGVKPVPPDEAVAVRWRVQPYVEPPPEPPQPSEEDRRAKAAAEQEAAFAALTPDSPFRAWLDATHYARPPERRGAAAAAIARRPDAVAELSALVLSDDREASDLAMRAIALMNPPPDGLSAAVQEVGRRIAGEIRTVNARASRKTRAIRGRPTPRSASPAGRRPRAGCTAAPVWTCCH